MGSVLAAIKALSASGSEARNRLWLKAGGPNLRRDLLHDAVHPTRAEGLRFGKDDVDGL